MFYGEEGADEIAKRIQLAREEAVKNNMSFKDCYTHRFNRHLVEPDFKKGDLVLLHAPLMTKRDLGVATNKWNSPWAGPARIKQCFPARHNAMIEFPRRLRRGKKDFLAHFDRLKPYKLRPGTADPFKSTDSDPSPDPPPTEAEHRSEPEPEIDSDGLLLEDLEREELEMEAWDLLHREGGSGDARSKISFDPMSPPVRVPNEGEGSGLQAPEEDPWEEANPEEGGAEPSPRDQANRGPAAGPGPSPIRRMTRSMTKGLRNVLAGPLDRIRRKRK